ncbi:DUF2169 domain-containing protein [Pendulispora brunnea]|uniref:DUF2169 domain-containing protein n=1 Tax=Pendulispora brunnea TaxID=2905690 RepID=A0ABZ2K917_9BACT
MGVIAKRTYVVQADRCVPADEQFALVEEPQFTEDSSVLVHDSDLVLNRRRADVIVTGHAYAPNGRATIFDAHVRLGELDRRLRIFGDRQCRLDYSGRVQFSPPAVVETVALDWTAGYGGADLVALARHGDPTREITEAAGGAYDPRYGLFAYPRNPAGRGYVTEATSDALEACRLPNLEVPTWLLTPETLCVGTFTRWPAGPPVAGVGWLSYNYFPRTAMLGLPPLVYDDAEFAPSNFLEVRAGIVRSPDVVAPDSTVAQRLDLGAAQGAALGMQLSRIWPGSAVELLHLHPRQPLWRFALAEEMPRIALQMPDEPVAELTPEIRTVEIHPDRDLVCVVWVAQHRTSLPVGPGKFAKIRHAVSWTH